MVGIVGECDRGAVVVSHPDQKAVGVVGVSGGIAIDIGEGKQPVGLGGDRFSQLLNFARCTVFTTTNPQGQVTLRHRKGEFASQSPPRLYH